MIKRLAGLIALILLVSGCAGETSLPPATLSPSPPSASQNAVLTGNGDDFSIRDDDIIPEGEVRFQPQIKAIMEDDSISGETQIAFYVYTNGKNSNRIDEMKRKFENAGFVISDIDDDYPASKHYWFKAQGTKEMIQSAVDSGKFTCELSLAGKAIVTT